MTTTSPPIGLPRLAAAWRPVERACYLIGTALIASGLFHLVVFAAGTRPWDGPLSWRKPATFGVSFGLTLIAITWVSSYLRLRPRVRMALLGVFAADCIVEVGGITLQAWRDVPSHFNNTTPVNSVVAYSLAAGGAVLVIVLGFMAVTAIRGRVDGPPGMRLALRAGYALLLVGLAAGIAMIARGETLVKAGHRTEAYDHAGFLKWVHGVTLHAVLVLPLLAWWLERRGHDEAGSKKIVAAAAAGYVGVAVIALAVSLIEA